MSWGARAVRAVSVAGLFGVTTVKPEADKPKTCPIQVIQPPQAKGDVLICRKVINHLDKSDLNLRLYQYETCPFCCKVRAFLDYYGFSYEVIEVNPVTRSQIKFSKDYKKVPILTSNNQEHILTESSLVISLLATYMHLPNRSLTDIEAMYPAIESVDAKGKATKSYANKYFVMLENIATDKDMANSKEEREWREWVDEHFIHLISPNVYRTWEESLDTFKWFEQVGDWQRTFPYWERVLAVYVGAAAMWALSKRLKKRHNIEDERQALRDACDKWMEAIGPSRKFMGGDKPNLADISLYGAMNSFYGCQAFKEVIGNGGKITEWHNAMKAVVKESQGRHILESRVKKQ